MKASEFSESVVEQAALAWLEGLGYEILSGPEIAAGEPTAERADPGYRDVILPRRLKQALQLLNPSVPQGALEDAYRKLTRIDAPLLVNRNHTFQRMLAEGITVEYPRKDGSIPGPDTKRWHSCLMRHSSRLDRMK